MNKEYGEIKEGMVIQLNKRCYVSSIESKFIKEIVTKRIIEYTNQDPIHFSTVNDFSWSSTPEENCYFQWARIYAGDKVILSREVVELWKKEFPHMFEELFIILDKKKHQYIIQSKDKKYKITIKDEI